MIRIQMRGGLGNQMFCYAFYLRMKNQYPSNKVEIDYDNYKFCKFHNGFRLKEIFDLPICPNLKKSYSFIERIYFKIKVNIKQYWYTIIDKKHFITDTQLTPRSNFITKTIHSNENYYFKGTWGSEQYFKIARNEILKSFIFILDKISIDTQLLASRIQDRDCLSVSMHVRRGDYLNSNFVPLALTDYYLKALSLIHQWEEKKENINIFIISDDIEWCKSNLRFLSEYKVKYVNSNNDYEDLYIMTKCKYIIIANSTFSWWGAYLSNAKQIIAPKKIKKNILYTKDQLYYLYPEEWNII